MKHLFLNQAYAGQRLAHAWFLKIDPVRIVGIRVCVCVCVCVRACVRVCACVYVCAFLLLLLQYKNMLVFQYLKTRHCKYYTL